MAVIRVATYGLGMLLVYTSFLNVFILHRNSESSKATTKPNVTVTLLPESTKVGEARIDADGVWGYRADPFRLRQSMLERIEAMDLNFTIHNNVPSPIIFHSHDEQRQVCETGPGNGVEKREGWKLLQRVVLNGLDPKPETKFTTPKDRKFELSSIILPTQIRSSDPSNNPQSPRILCVVYTHKGNHARVKAQTETWGWRCDGFFAASTYTDENISSINLSHVGPETYENMWRKYIVAIDTMVLFSYHNLAEKTRSILAYVYRNYMGAKSNQFDYLYLAGDDVTVLVENLRNYLMTLKKKNEDGLPLYIGSQSYAGEGNYVYNGGGAGYILNRKALTRYMEEAFHTCWPTRRVNAEDRMLGKCMKDLGIPPIDTADKAHRQRFQTVDPNFVSIAMILRLPKVQDTNHLVGRWRLRTPRRDSGKECTNYTRSAMATTGALT